jgi:hypothetical protein
VCRALWVAGVDQDPINGFGAAPPPTRKQQKKSAKSQNSLKTRTNSYAPARAYRTTSNGLALDSESFWLGVKLCVVSDNAGLGPGALIPVFLSVISGGSLLARGSSWLACNARHRAILRHHARRILHHAALLHHLTAHLFKHGALLRHH